MSIQALLSADNIVIDAVAENKDQLLKETAKLLGNNENLYAALVSREHQGSTGMGNGIAIPHGRVNGISSANACLIKLNKAIDFASPDNQPVDLVIGLAVPADCTEEHLQLLASVAEKLSDDSCVTALRQANSADDILQVLR